MIFLFFFENPFVSLVNLLMCLIVRILSFYDGLVRASFLSGFLAITTFFDPRYIRRENIFFHFLIPPPIGIGD